MAAYTGLEKGECWKNFLSIGVPSARTRLRDILIAEARPTPGVCRWPKDYPSPGTSFSQHDAIWSPQKV
jgi:hypothetical protein